ncbi:hypothetical protein BH10PSE1_BH10PSE1_06910 [soil metagenome]
MKSLAVVALAASLALPLMAAPVQAQVYGQPYASQSYGSGQSYSSQSYSSQGYGSQNYGHGQSCGQGCNDRNDRNRRRYNSYNGQQDRPGDYRCDAYWDAARTDCNAAWRDQRPWRPTRSYSSYRPYGGPAVYQGEYGRPDVVYSGGGYRQGGQYGDPYGHDHSSYGQSGRDPQRVNWCCAQYRSYDPATGYYTAYSGEHVYCG